MPRAPLTRSRRLSAACARIALATVAVAGVLGAQDALAGTAPPDNPCLDPGRPGLLCPDLQMSAPFDLRVDREAVRGRTVLRAGNSINSVGLGPAVLRGRRVSRRWMVAEQLISRRRRGPLRVQTSARLYFKHIPDQGRYWKFADAAAFELWRLDDEGNRTRRVRTGPKVVYCLRDLRRTRPSSRSPRRRVFPACSMNPRIRRVTLGTSVGWSDIYPASYHEQWIDVTGLRGCFDLVHIADPRNGIMELDESNNEGVRTIRLPYRSSRGAGGCVSTWRHDASGGEPDVRPPAGYPGSRTAATGTRAAAAAS